MACQGDAGDGATQRAALRWLQGRLAWEVRLTELRREVAGLPRDEVAGRRAPRRPQPPRADHLSAAS